MDVPPIARSLFDSAKARYSELKQSAMARVVRREWTDGSRYDIEPFWCERHAFRMGNVLEREPPLSTKFGCEYGFDAEARVVVERHRTEIAGEDTEAFHEYLPGFVVTTHYGSEDEKDPVNVGVFSIDPMGRLERIEHAYANGADRLTVFERDAERVIRIVIRNSDGRQHDEEILYDRGGEMTQIVRVEQDGSRRVLFRRIAKTESLSALLKLVRVRLVASVEAIVATARPDAAIYAVALWVNSDRYERLLPPRVAIALEPERRAFVDEHGEDARDFVYQPDEWQLFATPALEHQDKLLWDISERANQIIWQKERFTVARKMVREVAAEIAPRLRKSILVTPDFVVFDADIANGDGPERALDVIPAADRARLRAARYV